MTESRFRFLAPVAALLVVSVLATTPIWGADLGRRITWLSVERVEVTGTRLLSSDEVIESAGVRPGQPLLEEAEFWENGLRANPMIEDAAISRRPPHTLRIHVIEKLPVALVNDGTLRLATTKGEILPIEPSDAPLDLPIVYGGLADSASASVTRALLTETDRLTLLAPALMRQVSEVRQARGEPAVLVLTHADAEILIPRGASLARLEELRTVLVDLESRSFISDRAGANRPRRLVDMRFDDQVVVRPSNPGESS
ncbi:MAG: FtsQ-type POTRA domain-containing protein [Gemmatimonadota bacterium]|jgi:hypothetical protein|nr:FtsQ-type POTRA domain-containing protein [Gemmatimonadota bacterium]